MKEDRDRESERSSHVKLHAEPMAYNYCSHQGRHEVVTQFWVSTVPELIRSEAALKDLEQHGHMA